MDKALGSLFYEVGKRKIFLGWGMMQGRAKKVPCAGRSPFFAGRPSLNQTINFVEGLDLRLGWDGMPPLSLVQATVTIGLVAWSDDWWWDASHK